MVNKYSVFINFIKNIFFWSNLKKEVHKRKNVLKKTKKFEKKPKNKAPLVFLVHPHNRFIKILFKYVKHRTGQSQSSSPKQNRNTFRSKSLKARHRHSIKKGNRMPNLQRDDSYFDERSVTATGRMPRKAAKKLQMIHRLKYKDNINKTGFLVTLSCLSSYFIEPYFNISILAILGPLVRARNLDPLNRPVDGKPILELPPKRQPESIHPGKRPEPETKPIRREADTEKSPLVRREQNQRAPEKEPEIDNNDPSNRFEHNLPQQDSFNKMELEDLFKGALNKSFSGIFSRNFEELNRECLEYCSSPSKLKEIIESYRIKMYVYSHLFIIQCINRINKMNERGISFFDRIGKEIRILYDDIGDAFSYFSNNFKTLEKACIEYEGEESIFEILKSIFKDFSIIELIKDMSYALRCFTQYLPFSGEDKELLFVLSRSSKRFYDRKNVLEFSQLTERKKLRQSVFLGFVQALVSTLQDYSEEKLQSYQGNKEPLSFILPPWHYRR